MIKYTIYKLIDPVTNEIRYIGLTFNNLKQRLKSHINENVKSHKCQWIKKLKSEGLKPLIESVENSISTYEEACEREIFYIEYYKNIGCDLTNHATGGNKNKKMDDETRKRMSDAQKERYKTYKLVFSEESKQKISESTKKRMQDPKEIEKLKIANKRYEDSKTEEQKLKDILIQNHKEVYQYDKEMNFIAKYPSIKNASRISGFGDGNIGKCCHHRVSSVGGFVWRFEGDYTPLIPRKINKNTIPVLQYDMDMNFIAEFPSIKEASIKIGHSSSGIIACCKGKFAHSGGFIWKYKSEV
jgi:hypothetical protein